MRELIEARIGTLDTAAREAIELVAFGEPIGIELVAKASSEPAVELLESKQVIYIVTDGKRLNARLTHPSYGEAVRAACPTSRGRRRLRQLAKAVESAGAGRVSLWRLDAGCMPSRRR